MLEANLDTIESDIFSIEGCDDINGEYAIFTNCKMLRNFGPVEKDSEWAIIKISFQRGRLIEFINNEEVIHTVSYTLMPS